MIFMVWISNSAFVILICKHMRIIEPYYLRQAKPKAKRLRKGYVLLLAVAVAGGGLWNWLDNRPSAATTALTDRPAAAVGQVVPQKPLSTLRIFSNQELRDLYNSIAYPNTQELTTPPVITGNTAADDRIRSIAEQHGYRLRSIPVAPIKKANEPNLEGDDLIQEKALAGWQSLKTIAAKENVPLRLNSAYRSVEYQRQLFLQRLYGKGITAAMIAAAQADRQVEETLKLTAPPGYSRHHTGYTIDVRCADGSPTFENSKCFRWLSANNYQKAKESGWIPSYPDIGQQGPEPEAWEYVWVGTNLTYTTK